MTVRERLQRFYAADKSAIKFHELYELRDLLRDAKPEDVIGLQEHCHFVELLSEYRRMVEKTEELYGKNFHATLTSLLSVGEDGMYPDELRFLSGAQPLVQAYARFAACNVE